MANYCTTQAVYEGENIESLYADIAALPDFKEGTIPIESLAVLLKGEYDGDMRFRAEVGEPYETDGEQRLDIDFITAGAPNTDLMEGIEDEYDLVLSYKCLDPECDVYVIRDDESKIFCSCYALVIDGEILEFFCYQDVAAELEKRYGEVFTALFDEADSDLEEAVEALNETLEEHDVVFREIDLQ